MPLGVLQHYTIEPSNLERTKKFYCEVLGLENGDRPPLGFPGYWLYSGGVATVHLLGPRKPREGIVVRGTEEEVQGHRPLRPHRLRRHRHRRRAQAPEVQEGEVPRADRAAHRRRRRSSSTIPTASAWS